MTATGPYLKSYVRANLLLGLLVGSSAFCAMPQAEYDALILAARNGQTGPAIDQLRAWHAAHPGDLRLVYDLATILDRAGQYEAALAYRNQILTGTAPAYAIKAIAHAALAAGRAQEAEAAYRLLIARTPDDNDAHAGLVYAWMAQDRTEPAFAYAVGRLPKSPGQYRRSELPMLVALAELHERRRDWLAAASAFEEVLRFDAGFRFAVRGRVFALGRAGLPFLAKRIADRDAAAFTADERARLAQDAIAHMIRFGAARSAADQGQVRFATTDTALDANAKMLRDFPDKPVAQFDRLVALRNRSRMEEAAALYETLRSTQVALPAYVKFAAADAYLYLRQPQTARELYIDGLQELDALGSGATLDARIALVYAHNESEQHGAAEAVADRLVTQTPATLYKGMRGLEAPNPEYARVYLVRSLLHLYNDRLAIAEARLAELRQKAPFNSEIRAGWAALHSARERPRAALDEYTMLLVDRPASLDAAVGRAETQLALNELGVARAALPRLLTDYPESRAVQNLARQIGNYDSPYVRVASTIGRGATQRAAESLHEAALYSAPLSASLGERFRLIGQVARANGPDRANGETRTRVGIGADYREQNFAAEAQVTQLLGTQSDSGVALTLSRHLSDAWRASMAVDTNMIDLPAAAMRAGIKAESVKLGMTWTLNESRQAGTEWQRVFFSDDNIRNFATLWWKERWITGPRFKLESVLGISGGDNSLAGDTYFNPKRDAELSLALTGEWLTWRRYQRWFKQRAVLSLGHYRQSGYGSGAAADLRYEQEWSRDDEFGVQYGVGRSFHPYDGERDYRSYFYVNLFGRLK